MYSIILNFTKLIHKLTVYMVFAFSANHLCCYLLYTFLEVKFELFSYPNTNRGAWWAAVHGVVKSRTRLSNFTFTSHFHALEKEMATHSSVLAWRIPGTGEPGGLPSPGSHRVGHDWGDLAAAAILNNNSFLLLFFCQQIQISIRMFREAWRAAVHVVEKSRTWLSNWTTITWFKLTTSHIYSI